jgi:hypothetical protein
MLMVIFNSCTGCLESNLLHFFLKFVNLHELLLLALNSPLTVCWRLEIIRG